MDRRSDVDLEVARSECYFVVLPSTQEMLVLEACCFKS